MNQERKYLIIIGGPTGIGKTRVAIDLALKLGTEIISCDSRQVYEEMSIGTAKPSQEELSVVEHHMIGNISIHDYYSIGQYERDVIQLLDNLFTRYKHVILCGGTGMYISAILDGLDDFPEVPDAINNRIESLYKKQGLLAIQNELKSKDPLYYDTVDLNNHRRIMRALGVSEVSGKPYSTFLNQKKPARNFIPIPIRLDMKRELLYEKINFRVDQMMQMGLENEAKELFPHRHLKSLQTVGYQELFDYFDNNITREEAISLIKRNSRRYAKRQLTWLRNKGDWHSFSAGNVEAIHSLIVKKINR